MIMETEVYEEFHAHYASQGAAVLDAFRPGWREAVDAAKIDMESSTACVIGQAFYEEWTAANAAHEEALTLWRQNGSPGPSPRGYTASPYLYGRNTLILATGGELTEDYDARDQWAADHGFLTMWARVDVTAWSTDPDVTSLPLMSSTLCDAWTDILSS